MIFQPGLYTIVGRDPELFTAVMTAWCIQSNQYTCYVKVPKRGQPLLCRPVDETALVMLDEVNLLPDGLSARQRRFPAKPDLELVR